MAEGCVLHRRCQMNESSRSFLSAFAGSKPRHPTQPEPCLPSALAGWMDGPDGQTDGWVGNTMSAGYQRAL